MGLTLSSPAAELLQPGRRTSPARPLLKLNRQTSPSFLLLKLGRYYQNAQARPPFSSSSATILQARPSSRTQQLFSPTRLYSSPAQPAANLHAQSQFSHPTITPRAWSHVFSKGVWVE
ncbi:hypothetical protein Pyn_08751 [Prunus yedoensis var. nudiflora]|uniref:Uncharacterized protein n=1 Tax=Prunus yedoensis var. nudiflora TaxID=2094558 RepID=A0A314ZP60_PRUYE|nr:hypothetical protein Pyn_08751 [Prunus yedoensis var. nudiflora]